MKRLNIVPMAAVLLAVPLVGCQDSDPNDARPRVALVMKSLANEFFKTMEDGAEDFHEANAERFTLISNGTQSEEDVAGQVSLVEQMMAQSVDAIVIAPADSQALIGVLDRAQRQGITVVNIDNKLDATVLAERNLRIPFVGPNNRTGARMAADYLAARLEPGDEVAILEGIPSAFNARERKQGFVEGMTEAEMNIVASQSANWEMTQANQVASSIVNEHPNLKALLCANDSMALGAVAALRDAGKLGQVHVVGFDNIAAVRDLVASGEVLCTVDQHADQLAVFGIEAALDMISGSAEPEDRETPVDLITADTLNDGAGGA